jgi:hypothetical protein
MTTARGINDENKLRTKKNNSKRKTAANKSIGSDDIGRSVI